MNACTGDYKFIIKISMYDTSLDEILDTLKQSIGRKQVTTRPTTDHSLCGMSAKSKSKKSTLPDEYKSNVFEKLYSEVYLKLLSESS